MLLDYNKGEDRENAIVLLSALDCPKKSFTQTDIGGKQNIMRRCVTRGWLGKTVFGRDHKYFLTEQGLKMATLIKKITATNAANKTKNKQGE